MAVHNYWLSVFDAELGERDLTAVKQFLTRYVKLLNQGKSVSLEKSHNGYGICIREHPRTDVMSTTRARGKSA